MMDVKTDTYCQQNSDTFLCYYRIEILDTQLQKNKFMQSVTIYKILLYVTTK